MDSATAMDAEGEKPRKVRPVKLKDPAQEAQLETLTSDEPSSSQRRTRTPLRGDPVVALFLICLIVGLATTVLALFENDVARRVGLMGPLVATLAYPLIGWAMGIATRPSARERFADNCYYLGFIFTQAALFLVFLPSTLGDRPLESRDILGFFGMALSAALTGLIARSILVQLGSSLPEAEDAIHEEVEEVARQVSERSRVIVGEFAAMADAAGTVTATINGSLDQLTGSLDRFDEVLRKELQSFEQGAASVDAALEGAEGAINSSKETFGTHVENAARALGALQSGLSAKADQALLSLGGVTAALERGSGALSGLGSITPQLESLNVKLKVIEQLPADVEQQRSRLNQAVDGSVARIESELHTSTRIIGDAASGSARELQKAIEDAKVDLQSKARQFDEDLAATTERLSVALAQFREELTRLSGTEGRERHAT